MKIKIFLFFILSGFFISCRMDDLSSVNSDGDGRTDGFFLSYSIEKSVSPFTKSSIPIEDGEDTIDIFYILFFENTTGGTGAFIDAVEFDSSGLQSSGTLDVVFPAGSELSNTKDYKLILLANTDVYIGISGVQDLKDFCKDKTENAVENTLLCISGVEPSLGEEDDNTNLIEMNKLPMSAGIIKKAFQNNLSVELIRIVSRFDVVCEAPEYILKSVSVWNAMTTTTLTESPFNDFTNAKRTERYYGVSAQGNKIAGSLYAFANYVKAPEQNDKLTTCLIVGLSKQGTSDVEYFRANINVLQSGHQIKRNNVYCTTIMGVTSKGADNERDAYEGKENLLYYLELIPTSVPNVPAAGGSTDAIEVRASGPWTATLNRSGYYGEAGFNGDVSRKEIKGEGDDSFKVMFSALTLGSVYPRMDITVTLDDIEEEVTKTISICQDPLSEGLIIWSNVNKPGVLTNNTITNYTYYVYDLGENIRNTQFFGPEGKIVVPGGYKFVHTKPFDEEYVFGQASVFQAMDAPQVDEYKRIQELMQLYDNKLLMITNNTVSSTQMTRSLSRYNEVFEPKTEYAVKNLAVSAATYRFMNRDIEHPLIDYLLEDGPFTDSRVDRTKIQLQGYSSNGGLTSWNDTFVPIIMVTHLKVDYCVFGIDPVERLIIMTDPAIFGNSYGRTKTIYNNNNYIESKPENRAFLNNFIAWMTNVALEGDDFLEQFR